MQDSLWVGWFLWENSEHEVSLFAGLESGQHDVLSGQQTKAWAHLPQVDEELRASAGHVTEEEISLQVYGRPARETHTASTEGWNPEGQNSEISHNLKFSHSNGLSSYLIYWRKGATEHCPDCLGKK